MLPATEGYIFRSKEEVEKTGRHIRLGFILPDGKEVEVNGKGHCACAFDCFIRKNYFKEWIDSALAEDIFAVLYLGMIKVADTEVAGYLWVPEHPSSYQKELIKEMSSKLEVTVIRPRGLELLNVNTKSISRRDYNTTVIRGLESYLYNPIRIGD